jgi:hypothetical protein
MVKKHLSCFRVYGESTRRAQVDAGTTVGASGFIANYILAQGLNFHSHFGEVLDTFVVISLVAAQLHNHQPFLSWCNRGFNDVKSKVEVLSQSAHYGLIGDAGREAQHYSF